MFCTRSFINISPCGTDSFASQGLGLLPCFLNPVSESYSQGNQRRRDPGLSFLAFGAHGGVGWRWSLPLYPGAVSFSKARREGIVCHQPLFSTLELGRLSGVIVQSRCRPILQVKIWFQNKRSKFKKLMKQGGAALEGSALANGRALSAGSPPVPPGWNPNSSSGKGSGSSAGSYVPSYTSWYPSAHQEAMQQPQLM